MKIAINGFGRIGRSVFRILDKRADAEVVAINDVFDHDALRYLLNYDTVMGRFEGTSRLEGDDLVTAHGRTRMIREKDPLKLPWRDLNVDAVVESTGIFTTREQLSKHLEAGAKRVVLTVPAKDKIDYTCVLGVNDDGLKPEHRTISNASCTTNCLAPVAKVVQDEFGIVRGLMTTIHSYTNDQRVLDVVHKDPRRARSAEGRYALDNVEARVRHRSVTVNETDPLTGAQVEQKYPLSIDAPLMSWRSDFPRPDVGRIGWVTLPRADS